MLIKEEAAASEITTRIKAIQAGQIPEGYKRSKAGIIPEEWCVLRFDKITEKTGRKKLKNEDLPAYSINNQIGFCSQSEQFEKDGYSNTSKDGYTVVSKGTFAYNPARINVGSIGLLKDQSQVMISSLYVCFKMSSECDLPFFEYYFKSHRFNYDVNAYTEGSVREYLFYDNFSKISVSFPPLPEQQKIAEILSTQDKVIGLKEKLLEQKQTQKKWLMQKLLSNDGAIFTLGGLRIDKSGWKNTKLKDVGTFSKGAGIKREDANSGTIPAVRYGEIYTVHNEYIKNFYSFISEEIASQSKLLKKGDLLFSCSGETKEDIGKCVAFISDCRAYAGGDIILLSPKQSFDSKFLGFLLNSDIVNKQRCGYAQGDSIVHISSESLGKMSILLPPLPEQQAIAEVLSTADKEIDLLKSDIEKEKQKKKALMQLLLTGIVRVKL